MKTSFAGPVLTPAGIAKRFRSLSKREAEVSCLAGHRLSTYEIAGCLSISPRTVEKHLEKVFRKLGVKSREELRLRLGVVPPVTGWHPRAQDDTSSEIRIE